MRTPDLVATERLRLHRPTIDDLAPIHALAADGGTLEETRAQLERWIAHWEDYGFGYWVVRNDAGEFVGIGGMTKTPFADGEVVNVSYQIAPRARRNGYATEVTRAAIEAAFGLLGLERVHAIVDPDSAASIAVARSAGMVDGGRFEADGRLIFVAERGIPD